MEEVMTAEQIREAMEAQRPDFDAQHHEALLEKISPYLLDETQDYPDPFYLLEYDGVGFSALDNIASLTAQKKSGKTFAVVVLMAAILADKGNNYLPGLSVPDRTRQFLGHDPRLLFVDTEMSWADTARVTRRTKWLCGWSFDIQNPRFHALNLRLCDRRERLDVILNAMNLFQPDAVFIDGLRDLIPSINDENTAIEICDKLMKAATLRHCCIWNVLHQNPREGENSKMRGWIGSELANKCADILEIAKVKKPDFVRDGGHGTFSVKHTGRGMEIRDFNFEICDYAGNLGIPRLIEQPNKPPSTTPQADPIEDIKSWLLLGHYEVEWPATKESLKALFKRWGKISNRNRQGTDVQCAINRMLLLPQDEAEFEKGQSAPKYYLNAADFPSCDEQCTRTYISKDI